MPLTRGGTIAAAILGTVCIVAGGGWIGLLLVFFLSGTLLSGLGRNQKATVSAIAAKTGKRDVWQVLANGAVFTAAAAGSVVAPSTAWMVLGAGAIAASTADTWATEIGTLSSERPRSILTGARVPAGTSGGVTAVGTAAALAGAGFIAFAAMAAGWPRTAVIASLIGGFTGAIVDSLLGASIQSRRWCAECKEGTERRVHVCGSATKPEGGIAWLENDAVNALSALAGAATAGLFLL